MCFSFFLLSDFLPTKSWRFLRCWVFWFLFFNASILEQYYSDPSIGLFEQPVLLLSWHDCDIINTTCQSAKREKNKTKKNNRQPENPSQISVYVPHRRRTRYFITLWRSDLSKCDTIILPLLYFYVYYDKNIQSHKGNQIQSLTLVNTKPPHQSHTSGYQLMYVGPHSKHRKNPQINSQSMLEWNVSHWDCSPGQRFPAFRLPITLFTRVQTHARRAPIQERWPGPTQTALWSCL